MDGRELRNEIREEKKERKKEKNTLAPSQQWVLLVYNSLTAQIASNLDSIYCRPFSKIIEPFTYFCASSK
jgi:hypothetical protein